jgi:hypothetical protein
LSSFSLYHNQLQEQIVPLIFFIMVDVHFYNKVTFHKTTQSHTQESAVVTLYF